MIEDIQERIDSFKELEEGWDGYGAEEISDVALIVAKDFVDSIFATPTINGGVTFEFVDGGIEIEITPEGKFILNTIFQIRGNDE